MTGIHGANSSPSTAGNPGLGAFNEGFLAEVLATLAASNDCALAPALYSDLRAAKPKLCLDAVTARKLMGSGDAWREMY